jgi:hypothetical protein
MCSQFVLQPRVVSANDFTRTTQRTQWVGMELHPEHHQGSSRSLLLSHLSVVLRGGTEHRILAMRVAGVILHRSCCLGTAIAGVLIDGIDMLNVRAVMTKKDNVIMIFADCVHDSSLSFRGK